MQSKLLLKAALLLSLGTVYNLSAMDNSRAAQEAPYESVFTPTVMRIILGEIGTTESTANTSTLNSVLRTHTFKLGSSLVIRVLADPAGLHSQLLRELVAHTRLLHRPLVKKKAEIFDTNQCLLATDILHWVSMQQDTKAFTNKNALHAAFDGRTRITLAKKREPSEAELAAAMQMVTTNSPPGSPNPEQNIPEENNTKYSVSIPPEVLSCVPYFAASARFRASAVAETASCTQPIFVPVEDNFSLVVLRELLHMHYNQSSAATFIFNTAAHPHSCVKALLEYYAQIETINIMELLEVVTNWDIEPLMQGIIAYINQLALQQSPCSDAENLYVQFACQVPYDHFEKYATSPEIIPFLLKCLALKLKQDGFNPALKQDSTQQNRETITSKTMQTNTDGSADVHESAAGETTSNSSLEKYAMSFIKTITPDLPNVLKRFPDCFKYLETDEPVINYLRAALCKQLLSRFYVQPFHVFATSKRGLSHMGPILLGMNWVLLFENNQIRFYNLNGNQHAQQHTELLVLKATALSPWRFAYGLSKSDGTLIIKICQENETMFRWKENPLSLCGIDTNRLLIVDCKGAHVVDLTKIDGLDTFPPCKAAIKTVEDTQIRTREQASSRTSSAVKEVTTDANTIIICLENGIIKIVDKITYELIREIDLPTNIANTSSSKFLLKCEGLNETCIIAAYSDHTTRIFDKKTGSCLLILRVPRSNYDSCAFAQVTDTIVAVGYHEGPLQFFDLNTGKIVKTILSAPGTSICKILVDESMLTVVYDNHTIEQWFLTDFASMHDIAKLIDLKLHEIFIFEKISYAHCFEANDGPHISFVTRTGIRMCNLDTKLFVGGTLPPATGKSIAAISTHEDNKGRIAFHVTYEDGTEENRSTDVSAPQLSKIVESLAKRGA